MYVYFQWSKNGQHHVQAFHKLDKAIDYVITQIDSYASGGDTNHMLKAAAKKVRHAAQPAQPLFGAAVGDMALPNNPFADIPDLPDLPEQPYHIASPAQLKKEPEVSVELTALREHMAIAKKNKTHENALKAIELYEIYLRYAMNNESALHTLQDISVVE